MSNLTHDDLCEIAKNWLLRPNSRGGHGCNIALTECKSGYDGEIPDAIGFRAVGHLDATVVVEAKVTRNDFLADRNKPHRETNGLGNFRYFIAPKGLINKDELPDKWGLLEVNERGHITLVAGAATTFKEVPNTRKDEIEKSLNNWYHESNQDRERYILVKTIAATQGWEDARSKLQQARRDEAYWKRQHDNIKKQLEETKKLM